MENSDRFVALIQLELLRQVQKWGEQNHPDCDPVLMGRPGGASPECIAEELEIPTAERAKFICDTLHKRGEDNWSAILVEEVAEAVEAGALGDMAALKKELIQVAAVAVQWLMALERRESRGSRN